MASLDVRMAAAGATAIEVDGIALGQTPLTNEPTDAARLNKKWRIVLVEDVGPVCDRLAAILRDWDRSILVAACRTLSDALKALAENDIDLLVTDIRLPDGDGIAAIRQLKATSPDAEAMVISVLEDEATVLDAIEAGASGYLLKDAYPMDLKDAICDLMAGRSPISSSIARTLVRRLAGGEDSASKLPHQSDLTPRETDILQRIAKGFTYEEIAIQLGISKQTVPVHIRNIYRKLSVKNRSEAVYQARKRGLLAR
jgi:DNA-binding NarL/FixJ family response regulator